MPAWQKPSPCWTCSGSRPVLSATLENVLSFSRFHHQAPLPRPTAVPLRKMLADLVRTQDVQARHQGVPLQLQLSTELPDQVMLDGSLVQQVLGNLIRNALRHDDGQGVTLAVKIDASELVFIVTDHGPGLPPDIQAQLTRPACAASTPLPGPVDNSHSSGLGLLIVRRMTQALGGRLQLPADANGASIEVRLPLVLPEIAAPDTNIPAPRLKRRSSTRAACCLMTTRSAHWAPLPCSSAWSVRWTTPPA